MSLTAESQQRRWESVVQSCRSSGRPEPEPEPEPDPDPDPDPEPEPEPEPDPGPEPDTDTDTDPGPDTDPNQVERTAAAAWRHSRRGLGGCGRAGTLDRFAAAWTTTVVVRGLGRAFLCLSVCPATSPSRPHPLAFALDSHPLTLGLTSTLTLILTVVQLLLGEETQPWLVDLE
eukprot:scaffold87425_cov57-Phaeocystis_antarctica.AAC.1